MSSFGSQLRKRLEELGRAGQNVPGIMMEAAEGATIEAVRTAAENTPPNGGVEIAGTNTRSGQMAQHWETDSQTVPVRAGSSYMTALANNQEYASYVNDGHRLDKHFVPGLYVAGDGLLSRDPGRPGGMMVGTKTSYVPGLYMKEKAVEKFREVAEAELRKLPGEVFR